MRVQYCLNKRRDSVTVARSICLNTQCDNEDYGPENNILVASWIALTKPRFKNRKAKCEEII